MSCSIRSAWRTAARSLRSATLRPARRRPSQGTVAVTLDSSINYYRPGRAGHRLTAVAYERKRGRKTSVFMVEVHDDEGKHIADATFTMFYTGATLDDMKH